MPLVVVLHGCTMTANEEAAATGYDQIAAKRGFVVLYPNVDAVDRANGGCWKGLWDPGAEGRGRGDAGAIAAMTRAGDRALADRSESCVRDRDLGGGI